MAILAHQPEGEIEESISWIRTAEEEVTDDDKVKMNSFDRGRIQVLYVPATRDPARHLRHVAGSLIHPLLKAVQWSDATRETAEEAAANVQTAFRGEPGVQRIEAAIVEQWTELHELAAYQNVQLQPLSARFEDLLRQVEAMFRPNRSECGTSVSIRRPELRPCGRFACPTRTRARSINT